MNLQDNNRDTLILLYLAKADKTWEDANWLVSEQRYEIAAGRYYYACFYALQALLLHDGQSTRTHKGVQQVFLRDYVRTGKVDITLGAWVSRMERLRELADYNCAYIISHDEVESMRQPSSDIIAAAKRLIAAS